MRLLELYTASSAELNNFIIESNAIESHYRTKPSVAEHQLYEEFLQAESVSEDSILRLANGICRDEVSIRDRPGQLATISSSVPPPGGPLVREKLSEILALVESEVEPFRVHCLFEALHPLTDCNGRVGRAIWLWQVLRDESPNVDPTRGFMECFYRQALNFGDMIVMQPQLQEILWPDTRQAMLSEPVVLTKP